MSTLGSTEVHAVEGEEERQFEVRAGDLGLSSARVEDLQGGSAQENAALIEQLLRGEVIGPKCDIVALNAAGALVVAGVARDLPEALQRAQAAMSDGSAIDVLERLRKAS
jgi:anthranilate phosphoribosyltransferase